MIRKSTGSRARKIASGLALSAAAMAAQADPISLQATCRLTSIVAGQGQCQLDFNLSDGFAPPANIKVAIFKVDGVLVHRYVNDNVNPVLGTVSYIAGATGVSCGATHVINAFIYRLGVGTLLEKVGSVPAVACPPAP